MCEFFSFVGDGFGNYKYSDWETRKKDLSENWDSHTKILTDAGVPPKTQDRWSKYEYNPLTKKFTVDQGVEGHDHESAEAWVNALDFKKIVEPLSIKPIVHPFTVAHGEVTEEDVKLLRAWIDVGDSVWASVRASVWASVRDSVWASVRDSVWDSVGDSVWASVGASVWDSVGAYASSFFAIKYPLDFSPCVRLWESGLVPSFDGKTWRLHGKDGVVFTL